MLAPVRKLAPKTEKVSVSGGIAPFTGRASWNESGLRLLITGAGAPVVAITETLVELVVAVELPPDELVVVLLLVVVELVAAAVPPP